MKNLTGCLKKILLLFSFTVFLLFSFKKYPAQAQQDFNIYTNFSHVISETTINTQAVLQIRSENTQVVSFYTASIPIKNLDVHCKIIKTGKDTNCTKYYRGSVTDILIDLQNSVVSKDSPIEVELTYSIPTNQDTNSYTIPSEVLDAKTNGVTITYPQKWGEPLWTSDPFGDLKLNGSQYSIYISNPQNADISILFGKSIIYKFSVNRVFSNQGNSEPQTFELVLPPDTHKQNIIWEEISPLPNSTIIDEDGNYTFKYIVESNQTVDCKITGYINLAENNEKLNPDISLTKETGYWKITDEAEKKRLISYLLDKGLTFINDNTDPQKMTEEQRQLFYKYLYTYIIDRLNYDKDTKLGISNTPRVGANSIIKTPNKANAQDYADFYIALLRKMQIPAKMVIGYISNISGYASDGFYHYWVEYFDLNKSQWIQVDPFLEEYTGHSLFGSPLYDHITILTRGQSPLSPTITFYSQNDFVVASDTNSQIQKNFNVTSQISFDEYNIAKKYAVGYIYSSNNGNIAVTETQLNKSDIPNISKYIDPVAKNSSQILLPKQSRTIQINIPSDEIGHTDIFINLTHTNPSGITYSEQIKTTIPSTIPIPIKILGKVISITIFALVILLLYLLFNRIIVKKPWKQH